MKTLRSKITLLVTTILIATMGILTAFSVYSSNRHFVSTIAALPIEQAINKEVIESGEANEISSSAILTTSTLPINENITVATVVTNAQQAFKTEQIVVMFLIVILGAILTYFLTKKTLEPLKQLNKATMEIDENKLNFNITVPKSKDEISHLTKSFNSMLTRLNNSFEVQKNFANNAAHELKTPLAIIKSSFQVLELDNNPTLDDYKENAALVKESTEELIGIVEQLLALTNKQDIEKEELNLKNILLECIEDYQGQIKEKNIIIEKNLSDIYIYSSYSLLKSVVSNVLSNAIKYNKENGKIELITAKEGQTIKILIKDSGKGMDEENIKHIFEPFYRIDESRSKLIEGNGLGLSIVENVLKNLDGDINIKSKPQVGTEVEITLKENIIKK